MKQQTKINLKNVFLRIIENPSLSPLLNDLDFIENTKITFVMLSSTVFDLLRENHGTHLSVIELMESLDCDYKIATQLHNAINQTYKNISFDEFNEFLGKGSLNDLLEILNIDEVKEILIDSTNKSKDKDIEKDELIDEEERDTEIEETFNCVEYILNQIRENFSNRSNIKH
jgi:hypothetical protein